jgi:hypothetical protein
MREFLAQDVDLGENLIHPELEVHEHARHFTAHCLQVLRLWIDQLYVPLA